MIARKAGRKPSQKAAKPAQPVTEILLELAYYLNASRVAVRSSKDR